MHVSLQVEEGTPFERWEAQGKLALPTESHSASMLAHASQQLRSAGYEHYELSNFAQPGHTCKHNLGYWQGHSYYAFGLGAASFLQRTRFSRPRQLAKYYTYVDAIADASSSGVDSTAGGYVAGVNDGEAALSEHDVMLESIMLQLRLRGGISLATFTCAFGRTRLWQLLASMRTHLQEGRAQLFTASQNTNGVGGSSRSTCVVPFGDAESKVRDGHDVHLALTDPAGLMVSNDIISDAFAALEETAPDRLGTQSI